MANPIKFRCFQCNQLLGVSRSKAGEVVSCPKCAAELIVPELGEVAPQLAAGAGTQGGIENGGVNAPRTVPSSAFESGSTLDLLDIRPEDIRVEAGVVGVSPPPYTYKSPGPMEPEPEEEPAPEPEPETRRVEPTEIARPKTLVEPATPPDYQVVTAPTVVPPIQTNEPLQAPHPRRTVAPPPRSRDLVIPRSVVTAWSLFVLLALGMTFVAGLLAGHYVWAVH
jgi:hypothetical protein